MYSHPRCALHPRPNDGALLPCQRQDRARFALLDLSTLDLVLALGDAPYRILEA